MASATSGQHAASVATNSADPEPGWTPVSGWQLGTPENWTIAEQPTSFCPKARISLLPSTLSGRASMAAIAQRKHYA